MMFNDWREARKTAGICLVFERNPRPAERLPLPSVVLIKLIDSYNRYCFPEITRFFAVLKNERAICRFI